MKEIDGFRDENLHAKWRGDIRPIENVYIGETFKISIPDSSTKQIMKDSSTKSLKNIDGSKFDMAVGPIYVKGAKRGDILEVSIKKIETANWGWSAVMKDFGLLKGLFKERLVLWDISDGLVTSASKNFLHGIKIPIRPFLGVIGTAPSSGEYPMIPPQHFGGNMDNKLIGEGSKLYLPVNKDGGLISFADPHASQGDGEVCGTAVETSAKVTVSINVIRGKKLNFPRMVSKERGNGKVLVTQGFSPDLLQAAKEAVKEMISVISDYGFSKDEGYVLCSVAGNLKISEIVDEPNFGVSMSIPASILEAERS